MHSFTNSHSELPESAKINETTGDGDGEGEEDIPFEFTEEADDVEIDLEKL